MPNYLIWSTESAVLGLWAIALAAYASAFHSFVAYSHALLSCLTLAVHLVAVAQNFPIQDVISDAFVCAVSALVLTYVVALSDSNNYTTLFTYPILGGFLPLDGCVGLAWCTAAEVSAIGMALSVKGRRTPLMLHHCGYHISVVLPAYMVLWVDNYSGALLLALTCIWVLFVAFEIAGQVLTPDNVEWSATLFGQNVNYNLFQSLKLFGRLGPMIISIFGAAAASGRSSSQAVLMWLLAAVAIWNTFDWFELIQHLIKLSKPAAHQSEQAASQPTAPYGPLHPTSTADPAAVPMHSISPIEPRSSATVSTTNTDSSMRTNHFNFSFLPTRPPGAAHWRDKMV